MKNVFALLLLLCSSVFSEDVNTTIAWDANPEPDTAGYRVYFGMAPGKYTDSFDNGMATTAVIKAPLGVIVFCAVTAYDTGGFESLPCKELPFQSTTRELHKVPSPPVGLHVTQSIKVAIESSLDLRVWNPVYSINIEPDNKDQLYRLVLSENK